MFNALRLVSSFSACLAVLFLASFGWFSLVADWRAAVACLLFGCVAFTLALVTRRQ